MVSAPNKVVIDNIIKCSYRVTIGQYEEYGGALILGTGFDLSQVEWIAVYRDGELYREFEPASVIDIPSGDWDDVRIKVNNLTECSNMFCDTRLKSADFSTVDTGNITNCASMFERTLITVSPFDVLPIKNLSSFCCRNMFSHCESLVIAPSLPATKLETGCYEGMFFGCIKLCYIKMLATDISAIGCLSSWVYDVASTGTFVKSKDATWNVTGVNGVPTGWTVITDDQLVNGKVVNPISVWYGFRNMVNIESVYPVSSSINIGYDITDGGEKSYVYNAIDIGDTLASPVMIAETIPITDIIYGPKEDACFIYDFSEANEDITLSLFHLLLLDEIYSVESYERGMTWREYCGSRYNNLGCYIHDDVLYYNIYVIEDANGNFVSPDDLIVENGNYYAVE